MLSCNNGRSFLFVFEKISVREITDYCACIVCDKLRKISKRFPSARKRKAGVFEFITRFEERFRKAAFFVTDRCGELTVGLTKFLRNSVDAA